MGEGWGRDGWRGQIGGRGGWREGGGWRREGGMEERGRDGGGTERETLILKRFDSSLECISGIIRAE